MEIEAADQTEPFQPSNQSEQSTEVGHSALVLHIDGSSAAGGSGVGIVFKTPEGAVIEQAVRL